MTYIVQSTEKIKASGADFETKAMLYLMNGREDSCEIFYFVVDFFNDVTGLNKSANKTWDVQSKAKSNSSPRSIGKELVTLFKNYMSDLKFDYLILFLGGVSGTLRINSELNIFNIDNITPESQVKIKEGLFEEGKAKIYINNDWLTDENFRSFISCVTFVVDDKSKAEYIKGLINVNPKYIPQDKILDSIFNTIRDKQSCKKNTPSVEGKKISKISDCLRYDRSIKAKEIRMMVLNSFMNFDLMSNGAPSCFLPLISGYDYGAQKDVLEDCQLQISTLLFNKENADLFWKLFETILDRISENSALDVSGIYDLIAGESVLQDMVLDIMAIKYLIAVMKEALVYDYQKDSFRG